jgi:diacylglycerol kinase
MVCCVTLAALFGLLLRPVLGPKANPLAWRAGIVPPRAVGRLNSFAHAFAGLGFLVRNEPNMRIHLAAASVVILAGAWLEIGVSDWRWLIAAMAAVLAAEALNTGVEQACNAITHEHRAEIKAAKDVAAAGVLVTAIAAALIGASVFVPHFHHLPGSAVRICGDLP